MFDDEELWMANDASGTIVFNRRTGRLEGGVNPGYDRFVKSQIDHAMELASEFQIIKLPDVGPRMTPRGVWDVIENERHRLIAYLWNRGETEAEIAAHFTDMEKKTVHNTIGNLRKTHGRGVVPYHRKSG